MGLLIMFGLVLIMVGPHVILRLLDIRRTNHKED
jgi:hypothetical protein